ncbi:MAG: hypothetical protein K1X57_01200 [Gemmataceae bacterium]|nr:hypothetical protein [Gemmataceae bacterium]
MQLVTPEILAEVGRLSLPAVAIGFMLGLALWLTGWMKRTFWIALSVTSGFGLYGLGLGRASGTHPLVTALLLGIAAGFLAIELSRLIAFVTGGLATAVAIQTFVPSFPEPLLAYLVGGLVCVVMYKLWTQAVFGFVGTLVTVYTGLILGAVFLRIDVFGIVRNKSALVNAIVAIGTLLSMVMQSRFEIWWTTREERNKSKALELFSAQERAALESAKPAKPKHRMMGLLKPKQVA